MRLSAVLLILIFAAPGRAADEKSKIDDEVKAKTAKGLEWLANKQNTDGSWGDSSYPNNTAITGFALMAFMSQGHVPNQGKYGQEVSKGVRFLVASQRDDGYLVGTRGGNMYCHGMATLALTQLWGMTGDDDLKKSVKKAIDLIVKCQCKDNGMNHGGWRYEPVPSGADISVTIMQVMALRGAKDSDAAEPRAGLCPYGRGNLRSEARRRVRQETGRTFRRVPPQAHG
ncbi:MAG: terpene cyclase/mutase family protein [Planctomycetes bacterium]|nr:terpene cyclase/mutase family protein [Planctomycetota bacterium]